MRNLIFGMGLLILGIFADVLWADILRDRALVSFASGETEMNARPPGSSYWECYALDRHRRYHVGRDPYEPAAQEKALENCRRDSGGSCYREFGCNYLDSRFQIASILHQFLTDAFGERYKP